MKRTLFVLILILSFLTATGQANPKKELTEFEKFSSQGGTLVKQTDWALPRLQLTYGTVEARIREIKAGTETRYYYQIIKEDKYTNRACSINKQDLEEVLKAFAILKVEATKDVESVAYTENRFITKDGSQIGYYISKGVAKWYIKLTRYMGKDTIFFKSGEDIEAAFKAAKERVEQIEKLRKEDKQ